MLSSTAGNLFWLGRYIERAGNSARLLESTHRMWLMAGGSREWRMFADVYGVDAAFGAKHPERDFRDFLAYMAMDADNPSSIRAAIQAARTNARTERNSLSTPVWEYLNFTWLELRDRAEQGFDPDTAADFFDWVKQRTTLLTGAMEATLLRDEAYLFLSLGTHIERADNTARILDAKYHILLPADQQVGGGVDYYQWTEILNAISALRTYRRVYSSAIFPWRVAELMMLRHDLPRSLHYCFRRIDEALTGLSEIYGARHEAHRMAGEIYSRLRYAKIDDIFKTGLHEFLVTFIRQNHALGDQIAKDYLIQV